MNNHPKVVIFVQARTGSSRLPGKVMKKALGREILLLELERMRQAKTADEVVAITTTDPKDDVIAELCERNHMPYYRGHATDLLDRHYRAALEHKADFVVKIPSDSPFADPAVIDEVISLWLNNQDKYDFVSNTHPPTFPDGLDVEGWPSWVMETAWREAKKPHEREHTTPFMWDNPERFRIGNVVNPRGNMFMTHRWTLDYEADYEFVKRVFEHFGSATGFDTDDVLRLLKEKPEIAQINSKYNGVNWYRNVPGQLKTVGSDLYNKEPGK